MPLRHAWPIGIRLSCYLFMLLLFVALAKVFERAVVSRYFLVLKCWHWSSRNATMNITTKNSCEPRWPDEWVVGWWWTDGITKSWWRNEIGRILNWDGGKRWRYMWTMEVLRDLFLLLNISFLCWISNHIAKIIVFSFTHTHNDWMNWKVQLVPLVLKNNI